MNPAMCGLCWVAGGLGGPREPPAEQSVDDFGQRKAFRMPDSISFSCGESLCCNNDLSRNSVWIFYSSIIKGSLYM